jgi:release factor glutamine methyltransferase
MTIRDALTLGRKKLAASPSPTLDSRLLLEFVLDSSSSYLIAHDEEIMSPEHERRFLSLLERAGAGEPIPYIIERTQFYSLSIQVSPAVLIPRPETEQLVDSALDWVTQRNNSFTLPHIVDVGTGSGCIALAIASKLRDAKIEATDVSNAALDLAKENARKLGFETRIAFHHGNLLEPIVDAPHLIVANLPYIADHEWTALSDGVKWYEPDVALRGGFDGLDGIRQLLAQASIKLTRGGALFLEIGWKQGDGARSLAQSAFPDARVDVLKDYAANDRLICIYTR